VRILVVTWAWPPIGRVGALRPLGMAREWTRAGHEVHVLTGPGDRGGEYSPDLEARGAESGAVVHRAEAPGIRRPGVLRPAAEQPLEALVARSVPRWRQIAAQWTTFPDAQRSWIGPARRLALRLHAEQRFDAVWSTSPPESAHYVARGLAGAGVRWVADFRDQWSDYLLGRWDPVSRLVIDQATRRLLRRASGLTAATQGVCDSIRRASGREVILVRNGFDAAAPAAVLPRRRVLGYFGRVDPAFQHPERLWGPMRQLGALGEPWRVEFFLSPGGGGGSGFQPPDDLRERVRLFPPLPHADALEAMSSMTALLVLAWEARSGETAVAGKLYEYVGSGRPVLVLAPTGFEARTLVESTGTGQGAWSEAEIVETLRRAETLVPSPLGRDSLSRSHSAARLLVILLSSRPPEAS
jgi:Glycosyltransferase Family 4